MQLGSRNILCRQIVVPWMRMCNLAESNLESARHRWFLSEWHSYLAIGLWRTMLEVWQDARRRVCSSKPGSVSCVAQEQNRYCFPPFRIDGILCPQVQAADQYLCACTKSKHLCCSENSSAACRTSLFVRHHLRCSASLRCSPATCLIALIETILEGWFPWLF